MSDVDNLYGTGPDQIHPFFKAKREWSKIKDQIVGAYITCYLRTIQHRGRPIIIVDGFSGPGRFGDSLDGSPLIICKAIDGILQHSVRMACLFSDSHPPHQAALKDCLGDYISKGIAEKPLREFTQALKRAFEIGKGSTLFFYLDPYGIKDLDFETVRQIYQRDTSQSTEVLINFSFKTFMRMSGNWSYDDSASDVSRKVKEAKIETVNSVMGGDYWLEIVTNQKLDKIERENAVVSNYAKQIRQFFQYTYTIPVKEIESSVGSVPVDNLARYHLIFGTRSPRAVVYMNDVALNALEPYFNQFRDGLLFDMTPTRYEPCPTDDVKKSIVALVSGCPMKRPQIYEAVIPMYFMQHRKKVYRAIIDELTFGEKLLFPNPRTMKHMTKLNDETLLSTNPWHGGDDK